MDREVYVDERPPCDWCEEKEASFRLLIDGEWRNACPVDWLANQQGGIGVGSQRLIERMTVKKQA